MQPFPISYMPTVPPPCFSLRSRREVHAGDSQNSRLVEHWQTDSPSLINAPKNVRGVARYQDMNPTPSRLYREDMRQSQPYVVATQNQNQIQQMADLDTAMANASSEIQKFGTMMAGTFIPDMRKKLQGEIDNQTQLISLLAQRKQQLNLMVPLPWQNGLPTPQDIQVHSNGQTRTASTSKHISKLQQSRSARCNRNSQYRIRNKN